MVGREKEITILNNILNSDKSEFVAVYGRRRVGKTYLIDEVYRNYIVFRHTGLPPIYDEPTSDKSINDSKMHRQIDAFVQSLKLCKLFSHDDDYPKTWLEAFTLLCLKIDLINQDKKIVIFIDELPWMDTPKSYFLEAFSYFWNNYCCYHNNIVLVVCGSSSSWILDNVIHNHGGLYNRITCSIKLYPFSLKECEDFFESKKIYYSRYNITNAYMSVGGIPYYLNFFKSGLSIAQNIDELFFNKGALLDNEFDELFSSQFTNYHKYKKIVETLNNKKIGYTASELAKLTKMPLNSSLYDCLRALKNGGIICEYNPYGSSKNDRKYRLIDPFCLFYLNNVVNNIGVHHYWESNMDSQTTTVWKGLSFENVCFNHIDNIKDKLGIEWMATEESAWFQSGDEDKKGAQIDLIIKRKDNIINLCEIKHYSSTVVVNKNMHLNLMDKIESLKPNINKKLTIMNVLITTYGLKNNEYSYDYVVVITLDDLFK